jgi:hypothetical protein
MKLQSNLPPGSIPNDGQLDPASVDVAARKPRKRKARNRPAPSPELVEWAEGAEKRLYARPYPIKSIGLRPTPMSSCGMLSLERPSVLARER